MENSRFTGRYVLFALSVVAAMVLFLGVKAELDKRGKVPVTIKVVPSSASLRIDGKQTKAGKIYTTTGRHTVSAALNGFENTEDVLDTGERQELTLLLTPNSEEGAKLAQKFEQDYFAAEREAGRQAQQEGGSFKAKNPIVNNLPETRSYYSINYGVAPKDESRAVVQIKADSALGRRVALEKIRSWGINLADYEVVFVGFKNPFDGVNPTTGAAHE